MAANLMRRRPWLREFDAEGFAHLVVAKRPDVTEPKFLFVMLRRAVSDASRFHRRRWSVKGFNNVDGNVTDFDEIQGAPAFRDFEAAHDFDALLSHAQPKLRVVLRMTFVDGLSQPEMARRMNVANSEAFRRIQRGLGQIRETLALRTQP